MRPSKTDLRFLIYTPKNLYYKKKYPFFNANLLEKYQTDHRLCIYIEK